MTVATMEPISAATARIHRAALRLFAERGSSEIKLSELAQVAGVARGTIYNNLPNPETLFEDVCGQLSHEMIRQIVASFGDLEDPAARIARGIRLYVRRAHDEPDWGRFLCRFAYSSASLREVMVGEPMRDVMQGFASGRFKFRNDQLLSVLGVMVGVILSSILLVLEGHKTWRDAGSDAAELALCAFGIDRAEAYAISQTELPPLAKL
jgi:AcrR family transcriptional regulator